MFKKNSHKVLVATALIGGLCFTPLAATDVAYAAKSERITVYSDYSRDFDSVSWFELETSSISTFNLHGIHYVSFWMKQFYNDGNPLSIFGAGKHHAWTHHCLVKFEEDGSYHAGYAVFSSKNAMKKSSYDDIVKAWEEQLNYIYGNPNDDITRSMTQADMDMFNPKEWHDTKEAHLAGDGYTITHGALDNAIPYLRNNYADLIQQTIELNKRDEAAALAQHKAGKQAKANNLLNERVAEANAHHSQVIKDYKNKTSNDVRTTVNGLGDYTWDMFLDSGAERPNIDVNKLIHNVWKLDYVSGNSGTKLGPDGYYRSKDNEFHELVRFKPVFFVNNNTSEINWGSSLLEVSVLYHANAKWNDSQTYKSEFFTMEQSRQDGLKFWGSPSIEGANTPDNGGEKKIYYTPNTEGNFKTTSSSPMTYHWRAASTDEEFWLDEYYADKTPTGWSCHMTMVK